MVNNDNLFEEGQSPSNNTSTRREFITNVSLAGAGLAITPYFNKALDFPEGIEGGAMENLQVRLFINKKNYDIQLDPRVSLLDALREYIGLSGTKKGCNQGACGACTVLVDGERINACMTLAVQYAGKEITTIEGLADDEKLSAMQTAFIDHDGFQCGYCTSGQICSATAMLKEFKNGMPSAVSPDVASGTFDFSDKEIKERMSGNICRCGAYVGIVDSIKVVFQNS